MLRPAMGRIAAGLQAVIIALVLCASPGTAHAQEASNYIRELGDVAITNLFGENLTREEQVERFAAIINDSFDLDTIARFVLGRYWRVATPEQQEEYLRLYRKFIIDVYKGRLDDYAGQTMEVTGEVDVSRRDTIVRSVVNSPGGAPPLKVEWRVRERKGSLQVIDIIIEGISLAVTQRNEFNSLIDRNGGRVEAVLAELRERTSQRSTSETTTQASKADPASDQQDSDQQDSDQQDSTAPSAPDEAAPDPAD